ncbi:MAG TPA: alpha/beta hydrolase [Alphaproteobacteria bacterium]|nr:alpha/beta hydrolase [Alphaproteobacteria bacterium]
MTESFVDVDGVRLEVLRIEARDPKAPPLVFLHEGLGSVAMWRDFPARVAASTGAETIVYSRRGYGRSAGLPGPRPVDYMQAEAREVLPRLLERLGTKDPVLIGHSDGASIALIYAGARLPAAGLVLMAPHVFVEDVTVASIAAAREAHRTTDLPQRLGRYHDDPDGAFRGWNDIWLDPAFRGWNIEACVPDIAAPMLLIQGEDDEYGTAAQVETIKRLARTRCELALLPECGHSPQRDQPARTLELITTFVRSAGSR